MLHNFLLLVHIISSVTLIIAVLLQSSKGGGLAGTFGGSGITGGIFGGRGAAPFLVKATTGVAILFMITSITLNFITPAGAPESVLERVNTGPGGAVSEPAIVNEMPLVTPSEDESGLSSEESESEEGGAESTSSQQ